MSGLGRAMADADYGAYRADPRDPRAGAREVTIGAISYLIDTATERLGRAERMLAAGDIDAAIDTLRDIGRDLVDADWSDA